MNSSRTHQQLLLNIRPQPIPTLDNYVIGSNSELHTCLQQLAAQQASGVTALYLWGPTGSGRTHLLQAVAGLAVTVRTTQYFTGAALPEDLRPASGTLLIVDDVESLSPAAQITLFRIFNDARLDQLQILLSGSSAALHLPLREDLRTRIGQSLIYEVKALSDTEKASALLYHAAQRGMRVDDHIIDYLLRHGRRDLPSLMAVLDALDNQSLEQQRPVTLPLLREILQPN